MSKKPAVGKSDAVRHPPHERLAPAGANIFALPADSTPARLLLESQIQQVELELYKEDLDRIFNLSMDIICLATTDGRFLRINPSFARLIGKSQEELKQHQFSDFIHPEDQESTLQAMRELKAGRCVLDWANRFRSHDGSYVWLEWRATPYRGEFVCALARDITLHKQAEDAMRVSEEKFRSIVESSPAPLYLYHLLERDRLVLIGSNQAADRETGLESRALIGKTVEEAFPMLAGTGVPETYKRVATGELGTQSFEIRYDDEQISGFFEVHVFRTSPGTIAVAFEDISDRKKAEEALKRAQDELELRVQRRTAQLQERTTQLRSLASTLILTEERERTRIARLVHDHLQQMLVAALLNLRMLKSNGGNGALSEDFERIENILKDAVETTHTLTAELSPAVLHQYGLAAALQWLRPWCLEKYGLAVEVDIEPDLDPGLEISVTLFLCIRELLFNVVKHAGVNQAGLRLWRNPHDNLLKIAVSDQGIGFDPASLRISERPTGGIGLFNIRERMELLGGGLDTESAPGCGSCFTLWVPLTPVAPAAPQAAAGGATAPPEWTAGAPGVAAGTEMPPFAGLVSWKTRIVVAEDHSAVREGLIQMIRNEADFEVVGQAADGYMALQLARLLRPHFVVMDVNMPRMNGIEATAAIHKEIPCVKVLGISIDASDENRAAMIRAGAVDLLHKDSSVSELITTLRNHADLPGCP